MRQRWKMMPSESKTNENRESSYTKLRQKIVDSFRFAWWHIPFRWSMEYSMFECEIRLYLKVKRMRKEWGHKLYCYCYMRISISIQYSLYIYWIYWHVLVLLSNEFLLLLPLLLLANFLFISLLFSSSALLFVLCTDGVWHTIFLLPIEAQNKWNDRSIFSNTNMRIILLPSTIDFLRLRITHFAQHTTVRDEKKQQQQQHILCDNLFSSTTHFRLLFIFRLLKWNRFIFCFSYLASCQLPAPFSDGKSNNKIENSFYR